jgi:hypothetical protein
VNPNDFMPIGTTGQGSSSYFNRLVECPKCAAVVRSEFGGPPHGMLSAVERHIEWHKGLFDGWQDA